MACSSWSSILILSTFVFSVFLFYTFPSAFTLVYTTWYNTSIYRLFSLFLSLNNIFNMVSELNFILGIKQKSLASKEDSHVHITIRSHTCLFAGSRLHGILQPPWLCAVSKSNNQAVPLPIRFVHIKTSPVETNPTDVLLGLPRGKPRNPVNRNLPTRRS